MTALSGKYKRVFVGRILKKVEEDGNEIKGLVKYWELLMYNENASKGQKARRTYRVAWEGKADDEVLTQEEVHRFATDEFSTELCNVPEIIERQKVGWDESKLDQEDLQRKITIAKMMDSHAVQKKAGLEAAHIVAALDGEKYMPPDPPLVPVFGQPVDKEDVAFVCPPSRYKQIMKQGQGVTKIGEAPNPSRNAHPYDRAVEELGPRDPADPEVREEAVNLVVARVAFAENLKQAKDLVRRRDQLLKKALREEEGLAGEDDAEEQGEEAPRVAKPAVQKLDPQKMAQDLDTAKANLEQAKLDAEAAAKAARDFEEKHQLILTKGQSKPAAGLKSRAKAKAQPSKAIKPKEPAAEKGKGQAQPRAAPKKIPFGQNSVRRAMQGQSRRGPAASRTAAAAPGAPGARAPANAAAAGAAGPSSAGGSSPAPAANAAGNAAPAAKPVPPRTRSAEKRPRPSKPAAKRGKRGAAAPQEGEGDEDTDDHFGSAIQLELSHISEEEDTAAATADTADNAGAADVDAPDAAAAAATESDDIEMHSAEEAPEEDEESADFAIVGDDDDAMRDYGDGRSYLARLCMRPGDMPLGEWTEAEANNNLPTDREYVVEAILDQRKKRGKREFIVKWEGYELHPYQWFSVDNFESCAALDRWEAEHPPEQSAPKRRKRVRKD